MERSEYEILAAVEATHWWHGGMRALAAAILNPLYGKRHDLRILDAGCGVGGNARFLQRYGTVIGLDLAPEAAELSQIPNALVRGAVQELPFANETFHLVTSFDVLYHRSVPNEETVLREIHRVLRPVGRLLLRLPAYEFLRSKHDRQVHTRRRYTKPEVEKLLTNAGFFVEYCSYVNTLLFPIPLAQRLLEQLIPSLEQQQSDLSLPHPWVNTLLRFPLALEAMWVNKRRTFPVGLSILCLAHSKKYERVVPQLIKDRT